MRLRPLILSISLSALMATAFACGESSGGDVEILHMEPRTGAIQGRQPVTIGGRNFRTDIGYTVYFGTKQAEQVTILDPETLRVITPQSSEAGDVDVTIRADDGAAFRITNGFHYEDVGGNVVEQMGSGPAKTKKGNLAY
jgi:hypothetical protein